MKNLQELEQQLAIAREQGQPVMLDLYADWCVACKQFEEQTFSDPQVQQRLLRYHLLRVDVTDPLPPQRELLETLQVSGLPAILFFGEAEQPLARVDGFLPPEMFLRHFPEQCHSTIDC